MNESRLRKTYREKASGDWDEEGPYLSMSENEFVETAKELIKERDELIKEFINILNKTSMTFSNHDAFELVERAKKLMNEK